MDLIYLRFSGFSRDVGSISNLGGGMTLRGYFFPGHFLEIKRTLLRLLQNLVGHVPPVPPHSKSYIYGFYNNRCQSIKENIAVNKAWSLVESSFSFI